MFLLEKEKAFVSWWENEASKMNTTVNKLSARIAFGAGWRIRAQQSVHLTAFGAFLAGGFVGGLLMLIVLVGLYGGR